MPYYDRNTCMFDIECAVRQQDGTNSPFRISSTISFNDLCNLIAEKLERFPGHVRLHYRLDSDKAKAGAISIQTEVEFKLFKDRMQDLLVPPVLANGKKSSHVMKKVQVFFEDASIDQQSSNPVGNNGGTATRTGGGKQNSSLANTKTDTRLKDLIEDLQQRWKCATHTKGTDAYCYKPSGGGVCFPISHSNLRFWALEIVEGKATIDDKPVTLQFHDAWSRSRSTVQPQLEVPQMGYPGVPPGYRYPLFTPSRHGGQNVKIILLILFNLQVARHLHLVVVCQRHLPTLHVLPVRFLSTLLIGTPQTLTSSLGFHFSTTMHEVARTIKVMPSLDDA
ncbi:hypothetical protein PAXINDRAFT_14178 [Paxillus involutus ATCC 200175]|uniref:Unplaced genomic scaffold PAXINscaffold_35, whole genome shotgun sequence n=1 Tax=Paxillus involutus ATCC 200175 TaxID=664439 RepID=A0A0C9SUU4_PAXIN|nr:hypothetical protein PAXINDRAFT_14178 [Paxillus involutus ATCC 200175]